MARVYVSNMGALWRMSEPAWRRFLRMRASGHEVHTILPKVAKRLGDVIDAASLLPDSAKELLRVEIRRVEREAPGRIAGPGTDGKLRWVRLSPGSYRTRAANGKEYEIYRIKESGVPAVWTVSVDGEDVGMAVKDRAAAKNVVQAQIEKRTKVR